MFSSVTQVVDPQNQLLLEAVEFPRPRGPPPSISIPTDLGTPTGSSPIPLHEGRHLTTYHSLTLKWLYNEFNSCPRPSFGRFPDHRDRHVRKGRGGGVVHNTKNNTNRWLMIRPRAPRSADLHGVVSKAQRRVGSRVVAPGGWGNVEILRGGILPACTVSDMSLPRNFRPRDLERCPCRTYFKKMARVGYYWSIKPYVKPLIHIQSLDE